MDLPDHGKPAIANMQTACAPAVPVPPIGRTAAFALHADGKAMSTAMALAQQLGIVLKDPELGSHIVPIIADTAGTSDMADLLRHAGIDALSCQSQATTNTNGRQGSVSRITDSDALSAWTDAATSHVTRGLAMLPFHLSDSGFGFGDIGDLMGAAADPRARGFLISANSASPLCERDTPSRRHHAAHLFASTLANCHPYHPAFAGELAVIVDHGLRRMLMGRHDEFYYLTVTTDLADTPSLPASAHDDVVRGMYLLQPGGAHAHRVQLLGSGTTMAEVLQAASQLEQRHGIAADVWSVTSYVALAREGMEQERYWREGSRPAVASWLERRLSASTGPVVATTDCVRTLPEMVRAFVPPGRRYLTLGADDAGHEDGIAAGTQGGVNAAAIVQASLRAIDEIVCAEKTVEQHRLAGVMSLSSI